MTIQRSLRLSAARRNTLAACLAAALAAGGAGATGSKYHSADAYRASSDGTIFGALRMASADHTKIAPSDAGMWPALDLPTRPADTIIVTNCSDHDPGSLRDAFATAQGGGVSVIDLTTLQCPDSTITLTTGAISTAQSLIVMGPGQDVLAIDGSNNDRVFISTSGLAIYDLTIAHGVDDQGLGGCVYTNGMLHLLRATVTGCQAGDGSNYHGYGGGAVAGGGLFMQQSTITNNTALAAGVAKGGGAWAAAEVIIEQSTIAENNLVSTIHAKGGGIFASNGATISDSQVLNNAIESDAGHAQGGGIFVSGGDASVTNSIISGNGAHSQASVALGGGMRGGNIELIGSTVDSNDVASGCNACPVLGGGAVGIGQILALSSTVSGNRALSAPGSAGTAAGGGLATGVPGNAGQIGLLNSTVSGNQAIGGGNGGAGFGGGMAGFYGSPVVAFNSTIAFNAASDFAGGFVGDETYAPQLNSTIVANNQAQGLANDISPRNPSDSVTITGSNNLVKAVGAGISFTAEPLHSDPQLLPLAPNGGPTKTHAFGGVSPAIDAGNNIAALPYDQRGCPYARVVGAAADIGSFEVADHLFGDGFDGEPVCP